MKGTSGELSCFKAYDLRGRVPDELNAELSFKIGQAFAQRFSPKRVVIGHDIRLSSPELSAALADGLLAAGVDVLELGQCGTEEVYFAAFYLDVDGGIMVTASHNPADYNGMKMVRRGGLPVSGETGLFDLRELVSRGVSQVASRPGVREQVDIRPAYLDHLLNYLNPAELKPLKVVVNAGNGCAGPVIDLLEAQLPLSLIKVHHQPDGRFPNGVPNPLLVGMRQPTSEAVVNSGADFGVAWDGDFDRCFFFDEQGRFIEGYYIVGLLAEIILQGQGGKIIHDPRLFWNTEELVRAAGGVPVMGRTGHAFIKERMREEDAVYGGEMSAHHYFRDFSYCDSGMIPWLLVSRAISQAGRPFSELVSARMRAFPVSGEINRQVADPDGIINEIRERFAGAGGRIDLTDGLGISFPEYRFNIRKSNTEPLLRLNVETRGDQALLARKTAELLAIMDG